MINNIQSIRQEFGRLLKEEQFIVDKTGSKVIEIIGAQFKATANEIFGRVDHHYINREICWYLSQDLNVSGLGSPIPKEWHKTADSSGIVNSNYGWLIHSHENGLQFHRCASELIDNPFSRRAVMIYTRPSMWVDYNTNGRNDFICTNVVQFVIRRNKVHCIVQMRSNDAVYGYKNDFAWQNFVLMHLTKVLKEGGLYVEAGDIIWNASSLHVYSRHFYLVDHFNKSGEIFIKKSDYRGIYE